MKPLLISIETTFSFDQLLALFHRNNLKLQHIIDLSEHNIPLVQSAMIENLHLSNIQPNSSDTIICNFQYDIALLKNQKEKFRAKGKMIGQCRLRISEPYIEIVQVNNEITEIGSFLMKGWMAKMTKNLLLKIDDLVKTNLNDQIQTQITNIDQLSFRQHFFNSLIRFNQMDVTNLTINEIRVSNQGVHIRVTTRMRLHHE